jgi:hypothetical protein
MNTLNMKLDQNQQLVDALDVIDIDGNIVGQSKKASDALFLLEMAWDISEQILRKPTRVELGEWKGQLCWCDVRLNYGSVLPYLKIVK